MATYETTAPDTAASDPAAPATLYRRIGRRYARPAVELLFQQPRIVKYRVLSTCRGVEGAPIVLQPVLFVGPGRIALGDKVLFGWRNSPLFYTGYCHLEVTTPEATIEIASLLGVT